MVCEGKNITPVAAVRSTIDPPGCTVELSGGKCLGKFNNLTVSPKTCSAMEQCVCRDPTSTTGSIGGQQFNRGVCAPSPTSQLLETNNAICNISAYEGGLHCCRSVPKVFCYGCPFSQYALFSVEAQCCWIPTKRFQMPQIRII